MRSTGVYCVPVFEVLEQQGELSFVIQTRDGANHVNCSHFVPESNSIKDGAPRSTESQRATEFGATISPCDSPKFYR
jgi:hypothetical protein